MIKYTVSLSIFIVFLMGCSIGSRAPVQQKSAVEISNLENRKQNGDLTATIDLALYYSQVDIVKFEQLTVELTNQYSAESNISPAEKAMLGNIQGLLAKQYEEGKITPVNTDKAFYWYKKAVDNGHRESMNELANMYYKAKVPENSSAPASLIRTSNVLTACELYARAAALGDDLARSNMMRRCRR